MPDSVACAVVRGDPPAVFVADDLDTLNWVLALRLIARLPGREVPDGLRERLREALLDERWGDAVTMWIDLNPDGIDVYSSHDFFRPRDVELAADELQFTPLFED